jgi:hypothetical protein
MARCLTRVRHARQSESPRRQRICELTRGTIQQDILLPLDTVDSVSCDLRFMFQRCAIDDAVACCQPGKDSRRYHIAEPTPPADSRSLIC